jgi:glycosyltransferase involved in cell wall biosynthesis
VVHLHGLGSGAVAPGLRRRLPAGVAVVVQHHAGLDAVSNSADVFVLDSHHEGSGFALAEALARGVVPVVTDIPSFRVMTGGGTVGTLWPPGRPDALADALRATSGRAPARAIFDERLSWPAIGRAAVAACVDAISAAGPRARTGAARAIPS